ncbi:54S ribosomal L24, mitochondrial [Lecanosticta acicola]|uniref:Large ribosomal subunit protein bL28m n=1 Tax=Lecanosticta acicola TaxID=111012 RepID=A0AAI9E9V6_9PEZI|nr:54S ribosomal L24, mitochondrial [Lecanosticta acicola]
MATLFRRSRHICQCHRAFSTSPPKPVSLQWDRNDPEALADVLPPYPYGPTRWFKQSRLGLYGGQRIQFGNNVSEKFETKTRRRWYPNILTKKLFSRALNRYVQIRVSARVLRTIDKLGGLDEYLLGEKEAQIKSLGESGWWLRWAIMQTPAVKKRFKEQRERLGLPAEREELESMVEALSPKEEEDLMEETEAVAMDDAFQVTKTEGLRPIKFRVGRAQHVVLTADGWRRTRPDSSKIVKEAIAKQHYSNYVQQSMAAYARALRRKLAESETEVSQQDLRQAMRTAKNEFKHQMALKVDELYEERQAAKKRRATQKRRDTQYLRQRREKLETAAAAGSVAETA